MAPPGRATPAEPRADALPSPLDALPEASAALVCAEPRALAWPSLEEAAEFAEPLAEDAAKRDAGRSEKLFAVWTAATPVPAARVVVRTPATIFP